MTTVEQLTHWAPTDDGSVDMIYPKSPSWEYSQCGQYFEPEIFGDSLLLNDPFQDAWGNFSDSLLNQRCPPTLSGVPGYNEQLLSPPYENPHSTRSDFITESPEIHQSHANCHKDRQGPPANEPRKKNNRNKHVPEIYQSWLMNAQNPSNTLSGPRGQHSLDTATETESLSSSESMRKKKAHCLVEKRYRESLKSKYLQLEKDVQSIGRDQNCRSVETHYKTSNRSKRAEILELAHHSIWSLQEEVNSLKKKLQTLREATLPFETCQFTAPDGFIKPL